LVNLEKDPANWHDWEPWDKHQCSQGSMPLPTILSGIYEKADWLSYDIPYEAHQHESISISKITHSEPSSIPWISKSLIDQNTSINHIFTWSCSDHAIKQYWNLENSHNASHAQPYLSHEHTKWEHYVLCLLNIFSVTAPKAHSI